MKKKLATIISTIILTISLLSAQTYDYLAGTIEHNGAIVQSMAFKIKADANNLKHQFKDWLNEEYNVNLQGRELIFSEKNILQAKEVQIDALSPRTLDLYVRIDEEIESESVLHIYGSWGYNNWIGIRNDPNIFTNFREIGLLFITEELPDFYLANVKESREDLKKLEDQTEEWEKIVADNQTTIENLINENELLMRKILFNKLEFIKTKKNLKQNIKKFNNINNQINSNK